ncbi:Peroxisomal membrane signal receptor PTS1 [Nowakowskiella sp. JEL0078]|nr:Peroxisomal membrane signal receptor PTS1 [Nowakowskiella sp. JEL0078]
MERLFVGAECADISGLSLKKLSSHLINQPSTSHSFVNRGQASQLDLPLEEVSLKEFSSSFPLHNNTSFNRTPNSDLQALLESQNPIGTKSRWLDEFSSFHPSLQHHDTFHSEFEVAFNNSLMKESNSTSWANEFHEMSPNQLPVLQHAANQEFDDLFKKYHIQASEEAWTTEFANVQKRLTDTSDALSSTTLNDNQTEWNAEFEAFKKITANDSELLDEDFTEKFSALWKDTQLEKNRDWTNEFGDIFGTNDEVKMSKILEIDPDVVPYSFEDLNPYLELRNPKEHALKLLIEGAPLSEVALAFEAACQHDASDSECWMHLGLVQAENEKEPAAIKALQRSVKENPSNLKALMV